MMLYTENWKSCKKSISKVITEMSERHTKGKINPASANAKQGIF